MLTASDLRLQLLEPERFPYLYKCLYGVLMLLPQSAAFAALKNRLNSVSAIGYLHVPNRPSSLATTSNLSATSSRVPSEATSRPSPQTSTFPERTSRLKNREESIVRWSELLEKFKTVQEKARKARKGPLFMDDERREDDDGENENGSGSGSGGNGLNVIQELGLRDLPQPQASSAMMQGRAAPGQQQPVLHKPRGSLGGLKHFAKGVAKGKRG